MSAGWAYSPTDDLVLVASRRRSAKLTAAAAAGGGKESHVLHVLVHAVDGDAYGGRTQNGRWAAANPGWREEARADGPNASKRHRVAAFADEAPGAFAVAA